MTIPDNPMSTLWQWVARAPLPVVLALIVALGSWVWAIDNDQHAQQTLIAVAAEQARTAAEVTKRMDEKLDKVLLVVMTIEVQQAAEKALKDKEAAAALASAKKKETH